MEKVYFKIKTQTQNNDEKEFNFSYIGYAESRSSYDKLAEKIQERTCQIFMEYAEADFGKEVSIQLLEGSDDPWVLETCDIYPDTFSTSCVEIPQSEYFNLTGWPEMMSEGGLHSRQFDVSCPWQKAEWLQIRSTGRNGRPLITSSSVCSTISELFYDPSGGAAEKDEDPEYLQSHIMTPYGYYHFLRGEYTPPEMKNSLLERLELGLALEPLVAEAVRRKLDADFGAGHVIAKNNDFIWHPEYGVGSSFDYIIIAGPLVEKFGGIGNLEIKTVDAFVFYKKWQAADGVIPPLSYRYQTLFQSALLSERNAERGQPKVAFNVIGYMQNMQIDYFLTEFKEEEGAWILLQAVNFWKQVDADQEPDMTQLADFQHFARMDSARRAGKDKLPAEDVTPALRELAEAAYRASKEAQAAEARRVEMAAKLIAATPQTHKGASRSDGLLDGFTVMVRKGGSSSVMFNQRKG